MQVYQYPNRSEWKTLLQRPVMNNEALEEFCKEHSAGSKTTGRCSSEEVHAAI